MRYQGGYLLFPYRALVALSRRMGAWWATRLARLTCAKLGHDVHIEYSVFFQQPGIVHIENGCRIYGGVVAVADLPGEMLVLESGVQVNHNVHLDTTGGLIIGSGTLISKDALIYTHDHGHNPRSAPVKMAKEIGENVWVGTRATILPTCRRIGNDAIIGAGAVIARDVPDAAIMVGNPAKQVGLNVVKGSVL